MSCKYKNCINIKCNPSADVPLDGPTFFFVPSGLVKACGEKELISETSATSNRQS